MAYAACIITLNETSVYIILIIKNCPIANFSIVYRFNNFGLIALLGGNWSTRPHR